MSGERRKEGRKAFVKTLDDVASFSPYLLADRCKKGKKLKEGGSEGGKCTNDEGAKERMHCCGDRP